MTTAIGNLQKSGLTALCAPAVKALFCSEERMRFAALVLAALMTMVAGSAFISSQALAAESIKIGVLKTTSSSAVYVAQDKGYFAAEGLSVDIVSFDAAEPIAVAAVSGAIDIGCVGISAGMYTLGAQGALKIIAGQAREYPHFQGLTVLVSNKAYNAGVRTFKDIGNRTIAVAQFGSGTHYSIYLIAKKYEIDMKTIRVEAVQSISNSLSAVAGGQIDLTITAGAPSLPAIERGELRLLGWVGDAISWQLGAVFVSTKFDQQHHDTIEHFLRAFRKGASEYHDAFADEEDHRRDGPTAPGVLAVMSKYIGQSPESLHKAIPYIDPQGALDVVDLQRQIDWFYANNFIKVHPKIADMLDTGVVIPVVAHR